MVAGQRWKVVAGGDGIIVREEQDTTSTPAPERLPHGAIVEELALVGERLQFKRLSGFGPFSGWVSIKNSGSELLVKHATPAKRLQPEQPKVEERTPPLQIENLVPKANCRRWQVVGGGRTEGLAVRTGQATSSPEIQARLPNGTVVDELELVGDRLHFSNRTAVGPPHGWVSVKKWGKDILVVVPEGMEALPMPSKQQQKLPERTAEVGEVDGQPLGGWAKLSERYSPDVPGAQRGQAAAAAEQAEVELPPVDDLVDCDESLLTNFLGFPDEVAKEFVNLPKNHKLRIIAEAKALIGMSKNDREKALGDLKAAWPRGPMPTFASDAPESASLPAGMCFPMARQLRGVESGPQPAWGLEAPAAKASKDAFLRDTSVTPAAQKEFWNSLRCEVSCTAAPVTPEKSVVVEDPCRHEGMVDKSGIAATIMAKGTVKPEDVEKFFNDELKSKVMVLDGSMDSSIAAAKLTENDYRGDRFKHAGKESGQMGNDCLLVLTKPSLVVDIHTEFLMAGADIIRTLTMTSNAVSQEKYGMGKLSYEMNKAAAQAARKAAGEVTKQQPKKPRFVAGVLGPIGAEATWDEMCAAYDEALRGLVDGGVDLLAVEALSSSLSGKAAIVTIDEYFEKMRKKRPPIMVSALIDADGKTDAGQSVEACVISLAHTKPLVMGISSSLGADKLKAACTELSTASLSWVSASTGAGDVSGLGVNFVGGGPGSMPKDVKAMADKVASGKPRALPKLPSEPLLKLSGMASMVSTKDEPFKVIGQRCAVMGSAKFKRLLNLYKAQRKESILKEAVAVAEAQAEKGADILNLDMDGDSKERPDPGRGVMSKFVQALTKSPTAGKLPLQITSCEWGVIKEGLKNAPGKCIVNALCMGLGDEEFLRIAKECKKFGAAIVCLAIDDSTEVAETYEDKVRMLQKCYKLLRSKLDYPPQDIILDCQVLRMGNPEQQSMGMNFINAVGEIKRTCPGASLIGGLSNITAPFRGLIGLRDAFHSVLLYHAIPKGLNLAIAESGALPRYTDLNVQLRTLCEEMVLNKSSDSNHLKRFLGFVTFQSNTMNALPVMHTLPQGKGMDPASFRKSKEAKESMSGSSASLSQKKQALKSMSIGSSSGGSTVTPAAGAGIFNPCRVGGMPNADQLAATITAKGPANPTETAKFLNNLFGKKVGSIGFVDCDASKAESTTKEYFTAGCDIVGTNTAKAVLSGTAAAVYDLCKSAAQSAKKASGEATVKDKTPRFVAGVLGPSTHSLSTSSDKEDPSARSITWTELVAGYIATLKGLVDGGVDLLAIEGATDTLNCKAAIFAVGEYFESSGKARLPLIISAAVDGDGKTLSGQSAGAFLISVSHAKPLAVGLKFGSKPATDAFSELASACPFWCYASGAGADGVSSVNLVGGSGFVKSKGSPKALAAPAKGMLLSGLKPYTLKTDTLTVVGQKCNMQGSKSFRNLVDAYKYTKKGNTWDGVMELCAKQYESGADLLDVNFDSDRIDPKWAMGKFMKLCTAEAAKAPFIISSMNWSVIQEGLRNAQGKCIVNALSLTQGEEEFVNAAKGCQAYGAAVVVMAMEKDGEVADFSDKVRICQEAYRLLRNKLDFPAEDIIFDCTVQPLYSETVSSSKDFIDAVGEVKRTCPGVSLIGGISNVSVPYRGAPVLREGLHSVLLRNATAKGLNMAIVDPAAVTPFSSLEASTRMMCEESILNESSDGSHLDRIESYMSMMGVDTEPAELAIPKGKEVVPAEVLQLALPPPRRLGFQFKDPLKHIVQATGTINGSVFMSFGSKAHSAAQFHRNQFCQNLLANGHFSSISAYMGQGGSGPGTGASGILDSHTLNQKMQRLNVQSWTVQWGAIGEIGLRRAIYGSRDVFAQFDLGQKLIGPADTQFLMRALCCGQDVPEFTAMAYLDDTWKNSLAGVGTGGGLDRKTFADM